MSHIRIEIVFLILALIWAAAAAWLYFVAAEPNDPVVPVLYSTAKAVQFALPLACWALTDRSRFRFPMPMRAGLFPGLAFGVIVFTAILTLYFAALKGSPLLSGLDVQVRSKIAAMGLDSRAKYILFVLFLSLAHSGLEEYYWRAFVFAGLRNRLSLATAVIVSSLGFMAHHVLVLRGFFPTGLDRRGSTLWPSAWAGPSGASISPLQEHLPVVDRPRLVDLAIMAVGYTAFSLDR